MKTQNKVQLIGYLGKDPEMKIFGKGARKVRLRLATNTYFKKENKEPVIKTTWHTTVAWNGIADVAEKTFVKGSHILVEGSITYRSFEGKDGQTKNVTEILATRFLDLDR